MIARSRLPAVALALLASLASSPAAAQLTLAQDTLSAESPAAALCGFCGGEGFGVVFRELPAPARGLQPEDFPLTLRAIEVALGAAHLDGTTCVSVAEGGTAHVDLRLYAGVTPDEARLAEAMGDEPWPGTGEELVFAADDVPIELSIPATGSMGFSLQLNRLEVLDEGSMPIRVLPPFSYLRAFVRLHDSASPGPSCAASSDGSPLRDDGRIASRRSYILANDRGFVWNEEVGVNGDWAIRLEVLPAIPSAVDAGRGDAALALDAAALEDASASADAAALDASAAMDAGPVSIGGAGGCACASVGAARARGGATPILTLALLLAALAAQGVVGGGFIRRPRRRAIDPASSGKAPRITAK